MLLCVLVVKSTDSEAFMSSFNLFVADFGNKYLVKVTFNK